MTRCTTLLAIALLSAALVGAAAGATGIRPVAVGSIQMVDSEHGYGLAAGEVPPYQLLRTADGGRTWSRAFAAGLVVDAVTALDASTVFATRTTGAHQFEVLRSNDGGATWRIATIHDTRGLGISAPDLVDRRHGFVLVDEGAAAGSNAVAVYRTVDGGAHWSFVTRTPTTSIVTGSLPFGCDKNGLGFRDASTGWVAGVCAGGSPFFYVTHDAGRTWARQALSGLGRCQCSVAPPRFFDARHGWLQVTYYDNASSGQVSRLFRTSDGGGTWHPVAHPRSQVFGTAVFADAQHVWLPVGHGSPQQHVLDRLLASANGGRTWTTLPLPFDASAYQLDFVSAQTGFSVRAGVAQRFLWRTEDGGRSWRRISTLQG